jgi:hypothetical protein
MCISAAIVAGGMILASGVQMVTSMHTAEVNKDLAVYEGKVRHKQARERRSLEKLKAIETENLRSAEFARARSSAMAAIGASGLGENISFFQGIDPEQQKAFLKDIRNVRLNLTAEQASIRDEINLIGVRTSVARVTATTSKISAMASFASDVMSAANYYTKNS